MSGSMRKNLLLETGPVNAAGALPSENVEIIGTHILMAFEVFKRVHLIKSTLLSHT